MAISICFYAGSANLTQNYHMKSYTGLYISSLNWPSTWKIRNSIFICDSERNKLCMVHRTHLISSLLLTSESDVEGHRISTAYILTAQYNNCLVHQRSCQRLYVCISSAHASYNLACWSNNKYSFVQIYEVLKSKYYIFNFLCFYQVIYFTNWI